MRTPKPLPHQVPILDSLARFKAAVCGRRFGKSGLGLRAVCRGHGRGRFKGVLHGNRITWIGKTNTQADDLWANSKKALEEAATETNETKRYIRLANGGLLRVRSAEKPDNLRGPLVDGVVLDEAAFYDPYLWEGVIRPGLADTQGWAMFLTTPNGFNWFKDLVDLAEDRPDWEVWSRPSSDNPLVTQAELDQILEEIGPTRYSQEHDANFLQQEGAEWPPKCFEKIWDAEWPDRFSISAMGIDPSKGTKTGDYAAIVFVGLAGKHMYVDAVIDRMSSDQIAQSVVSMYDDLRPDSIVLEENMNQDLAFGPLIEDAQAKRGGVPLPMRMVPHTTKKELRIMRLNPWMFRQKFRFRRGSRGCRLLESQLRGFPLKGVHDDGPDGLEMAVTELDKVARGMIAGRGDKVIIGD